MTTQISQTVIYTPPGSPITSINVQLANVSGLGTSQVFVGTCPAGEPANTTVCYTVQAPRPAPLWYIATPNAAITYSIFTVENTPITLTAFTPPTGFQNGGYFQPNPGQKFNIYINSTAAIAAGSSVLFIQGVVENTLSQYVDIGSIAYEHADTCKVKPVLRMIVTGNSITAIPNTLAFDFVDYPIPNGINAIVTFNGLLNAQGIVSYGGYGSMSGSSATQQYAIIGGQGAALMYPGGHNMKFNGTIFFLLNNIGLVSLPPTIPVPSLPSIFDDSNFSSIVGSNRPANETSDDIATILSILQNNDNTSSNSSLLGPAIMKITDMIKKLDMSNAASHKMILDRLDKIDMRASTNE